MWLGSWKLIVSILCGVPTKIVSLHQSMWDIPTPSIWFFPHPNRSPHQESMWEVPPTSICFFLWDVKPPPMPTPSPNVVLCLCQFGSVLNSEQNLESSKFQLAK